MTEPKPDPTAATLMAAMLLASIPGGEAHAQQYYSPPVPPPTPAFASPPRMPSTLNASSYGISPSTEAGNAAKALKAEDWIAAERHCRSALKVEPKMQRCWSMLGVALFNQNSYPGARDAFQRAIALRSGDIVVIGELGATFALLRDSPAAQAQLEDLKARKAACANRCRAREQIDEAIDNIELALSTVG